MAQPKWIDVVKSVKDKYPKGTGLKDILPEASALWKQIKSGKKVDIAVAPAPAKKAKKGKKAMKGGNQGDTETARIDLPQHELYGGVNKPENVVRRPGMPVGGSEQGSEHSLMQKGAGEQLAAEAGMIDALTQQGGRRRRGKTARKSRKASKTKRSGRKHRKTARKTRKSRKHRK